MPGQCSCFPRRYRGAGKRADTNGLDDRRPRSREAVSRFEGEARTLRSVHRGLGHRGSPLSTRPHGVELRSQGEIHFGWILDGRAVQDVFMTRDPDTGRAVPIGTTVRFYDPKMDAWQSVWISPMQELVQTFTGRKIGDEIVLESKTKEGYPEKWIFSEITEN